MIDDLGHLRLPRPELYYIGHLYYHKDAVCDPRRSRFLVGFIERGNSGAIAQLDRDAEWVVPGDARFGGGRHRGWDQLVRFFEATGRLFPHGPLAEARREWEGDGAIAVEATLSGATATGAAYRNDYAFVLEVADGILKPIPEYTDTSLAERALAELEPDAAR